MAARTVVEVGSGHASAYCGLLMATLGADVIKVELSTGDPLRHHGPAVKLADGATINPWFEYTGAGKRSLALDFKSDDGRAVLKRVLAAADGVIWGEGDADELRRSLALLPERAPAACFSHFGLTGPYSGLAGSAFTDWAAGGYTYITGYPGRTPRAGGGAWCAYAAGLVGAFMLTSTWRAERAAGAAGPLIYDISIQDVMISLHQWTFSLYMHQGVVKRRAGNRHAESYHPMGFLRCADGWVCVGIASIEQWEKFCIAIEQPELLLDPRFDSGANRFDNADAFDQAVAEWFDSRTAADVVEHLQSHDVPASKVQSVKEVLADQQLEFRGFWKDVACGGGVGKVPLSPFRLGARAGSVSRPAAAGQDSLDVLRDLGFSESEVAELLAGATVAEARR